MRPPLERGMPAASKPVDSPDPRLARRSFLGYPETDVLKMTGGQIKDVLEDVCDNLFNADPYYQQGGDMVRVGGVDDNPGIAGQG